MTQDCIKQMLQNLCGMEVRRGNVSMNNHLQIYSIVNNFISSGTEMEWMYFNHMHA